MLMSKKQNVSSVRSVWSNKIINTENVAKGILYVQGCYTLVKTIKLLVTGLAVTSHSALGYG